MTLIQSILSIAAVAISATVVSAQTPPTSNTWGPLYKPDLNSPVTQGEAYTIVWDPETRNTNGVTVSLVLCKGNSNNCVPQLPAVATGIPAAAKSYTWNVPCDLPVGTQLTSTGYGMLIIVDGTGEFQYSTQFSVLQGSKCGSSSSSSSSSATSSASSKSSSASSSVSTSSTTSYDRNSRSYSSGWESSTYSASASSGSSSYSRSASMSYSTVVVTASSVSAVPVTSSVHASVTSSRASSTTTGLTQFTGAADSMRWNAAGVMVAAAAAVIAL